MADKPADKVSVTEKPVYKPLPQQEGISFKYVFLGVFVASFIPIFFAYFGLGDTEQPPRLSTIMEPTVMRIAAKAKPTSALIFLHGLGDSGEGWRFLAEEVSKIPGFNDVDFILPTAPERLVTQYNESMNAWYNIISPIVRYERGGVRKGVSFVQELIKEEVKKGIDPKKIIVGGFSQGAVITEAAAVSLKTKIGGFVGISGYLPLKGLELNPANINTPVLLMHGAADPVINVTMGEESAQEFRAAEFTDFDFKVYDGVEHTLSPQGYSDLVKFLDRVLH